MKLNGLPVLFYNLFSFSLSAQTKEDWHNLFNLRKLQGWYQLNIKTTCRAKNNEIVGYTVFGKSNSFLAMLGLSVVPIGNQPGCQNFTDVAAASNYKKRPNCGIAHKGQILLQDHKNLVSFISIKIEELQ